ncbi:extracellular solute-binding protein [Planosporangium thailandense]|uniref:Extracellular solute-binding protein n=1 Tax=Planosporangium thailandense TaxID=765197 RepID=A0ABX0Y4H2_9ACTN|nr:extracellular solute-binding protein [Planosporangium thailandense]NJC72312.1 extracellular solute-binding protein [Planosporangium thailandense]
MDEQVVPAQGLTRRGFLHATGGLGLTAVLAACGANGGSSGGKGSGKGPIRALFMKQAGYSEDDIAKMTAEFQKANPDIKVTTDFVAYEALHDKIVAAAPAHTYDVVLIDVIWPAEFGLRHIVADVSSRWPASWKSEMLPGAIATTEYKNVFYGVPWILDTKYLFFNDDHLTRAGVDPAQLDTWDGVITAAKAIKKSGVTQYPLVWSWQQAEALICDYAQLLGAFGGSFVDSSGKPAFHNGGGVQALEFMRQSIVDGLTNPGSTQSLEEDVRKIFSSGQASAALNWTYMYGLADDPKQSQVAGHVKVLQTPAGPAGRPGVNGSMGLAVSAQSQNQDAAWKYVSYLTSQPVQNKFALSSLPVWKTSYDDPAVVKTNPAVVPQAKKQLADMILRPQVKNYNAISQVLQAELQNGLLGKKSPQQALNDAADQAGSLLNS